MSEILWQPTSAQIEQTQLAAFQTHLRDQGFAVGDDFQHLQAWALKDSAEFWCQIWEYCGVQGAMGAELLHQPGQMPGAKFFPQAMLNFAQNLLLGEDGQVAIIFRREDGMRIEWTYAELRTQVSKLRAALVRVGVGRGDCVAGFLPNIPHAVAAMLAAASLGAIWSSCSPDFGVPGVVDRFGQIKPKVLFAADGYVYKARQFDGREKLLGILQQVDSIQTVVLIPFVDKDATFDGAHTWDDFLSSAVVHGDPIPFEPVPFDHPLYVMYSSGTTGKPKCIVHGHGGTLLQHLKEHRLHTDLRAGERLFYFTTTGWMMWNWLVTALAGGTTIVLFDGNPFHPGPETLWKLVDEEKVDVFGTSAKFIDACKKAGYLPGKELELKNLRAILSTGSPLVPESFDYVYEHVKADLQLSSISGGTDIVSCFMLGCPTLPVRRGEIQTAGLGMAVEVWNDAGEPVVAEPGELVCTQPFPSMPVGFWNDADGSRYRAAYFDHYPGIWRHGDWVEMSVNGGLIVYGRSDATLNPGGVRIGTAEIYRQVEQFPEIQEAIVVGQDTGDGDQRVVLFLVMAAGHELSAELQQQVRTRIRANATPRHVPAVMHAVADIPRTRSGKISEIAVRDVLHGRPVKNTEALANPETLQYFAADALPA
ncbi:MAG: acetoacetate--CoA ligase [Planctomycetes bacterium]|nr:acetoacetate--CoA ligase [Planctomycetota bacterium]